MDNTRRQAEVTRSIQSALFRDPATFRKTAIGQFLAFFCLFYIRLIRHKGDLFRHLRGVIWDITEDEYSRSFRGEDRKAALQAMGDMGYSGSTFFSTTDSKFLIKSLPRHFEHSFFRRDLLDPYYNHMLTRPDSLLVWITDYIYAPYLTLGRLCNVTPAHHIIMANTFSGRDKDPARHEWEKYDLKPVDYFYPERDLFPDPLVSKETMNKLADRLDDKVRITRGDYDNLRRVLEADTEFLSLSNAVDYSLLLVRFPAASDPGVVGRENRWRVGVRSVDGKWKYRGVVLDFFWAKHTLHAQAMTGVVQMFNVIGHKGPMTITTRATEYREKFLTMVDSLVEVCETGQT